MKLLILTQKVDKDDSVLGFFHRWLEEFAKKCEKVTVICLYKGRVELPSNVKVFSLGKEEMLSRVIMLYRFFLYIIRERKNYDKVFVHMNQVYVILGGLLWRLMGKEIGLWYVHKQVTRSLRIALLLTHHVFTSAKESFGIESKKVHYVGHGIDVGNFMRPADYVRGSWARPRIIHVGRITPIKHCEVLIKAAAILRDSYSVSIEVLFVGAPTNDSDNVYFETLREMVRASKLESSVRFVGSIPNYMVREYYWNTDLSANMCPNGGMDKSVLESIAAGVPAFVSNSVFVDVLGKYKDDFIFEFNNPNSLAEKIAVYLKRNDRASVAEEMTIVAKRFDVKSLVEKIISYLK
jgi:glycosyltransferase involved in cell wall biosynthesis